MDALPLPLRGLLIGFSIAAPVGPIGLLCIQLTLNRGRRYGFAAGLGAATADAFYGFVAGFGLTLISQFLLSQQRWLQLMGGLFLCYLGLRTFFTIPPEENTLQADTRGATAVTLQTFFLTLTNPVTILAFTAIFAGMGLANQSLSAAQAAVFVLSVFAGSALWWLLLSGGVSLLHGRIRPTHLRWINRLSGLIILGFGIAALVSWITAV